MTEISHELWKKSIIGKELSDAEARELYLVSRRERFKKNEKLFDEGDAPLAFFLIVDGDIKIEKKGGKGRTATIASLGRGHVVGEMSLLVQENRSASARVVSDDATVLRITWKDFEQLLNENRGAAMKLVLALARVLAARLKLINVKVAELTTQDPANGDDRLEEFAKFKDKLFKDWSF